MPDHVHLLVAPMARVPRITHSLKGFTAHRVASEFGLGGQHFWQRESFDHWLRTDGEIRATARYIVQNPVRKGLVQTAELWPWGWVSPELR